MRVNPNQTYWVEHENFERPAHILIHLKEYVNGSVLDLGCGNGEVTQVLTRDNHRVSRVVVCDYHLQRVMNAQKRLVNAVGFVIDLDSLPLPFNDHTYDTILLCDVIEHVRSPSDLIGEITRILRPGGRLLLVTPDARYVTHTTPHLYYFSPEGIKHILEREGYTVRYHYNGVFSSWLTGVTRRIPILRKILNRGIYVTATLPDR